MNVNNQQSTTFLEAQEKLIEFFLHSDIMPGMVLRESVLCKTFGVDRRSMREALCQAVGWGIAEYISFRGFRVRDFTLSDVYDWEEMRMALESAAASRLALSPEETNLKRLQQLIDDEREALINKDMENFAKKTFRSIWRYCAVAATNASTTPACSAISQAPCVWSVMSFVSSWLETIIRLTIPIRQMA